MEDWTLEKIVQHNVFVFLQVSGVLEARILLKNNGIFILKLFRTVNPFLELEGK